MPQLNGITLASAMADLTIAGITMSAAKAKADRALIAINAVMKDSLQLVNPENGWLTEEGKAALKAYWMAEIPATQAAKLIGISGNGAWRYYDRWNKEWAASEEAA